LTIGTLFATGSAVIGVAIQIAADPRAIGQSGLTGNHTGGVGAYLAIRAFFAAGSAVVGVSFGIDAHARAIGEIGGADAFARSAEHTAGAFFAACTAVIWVVG
jgi:hypothetical protein